MNTKQIIEGVVQETGMPEIKVKACINHFLELIKNTVASGDTVNLRGFGVFYPIIWKERNVHNLISESNDNPDNKESSVFVSSKRLFRFRASKMLNRKLNNI